MGRGIFLPPSSPPGQAAASNRLFSLKHFNPVGGYYDLSRLFHGELFVDKGKGKL
jgi:hypothetical protein